MSFSGNEAAILFWLKNICPEASRKNCVEHMLLAAQKSTSKTTIARELKSLRFTSKTMSYFSRHRDESDSVAYWANPPNHPTRPGVNGVSFLDIVDIDQAGRYTSDCRAKIGHALKGRPAKASGSSRRSDATLKMVFQYCH